MQVRVPVAISRNYSFREALIRVSFQADVSCTARKRLKLNSKDLHKWEYALKQAACSEDHFKVDVGLAAEIQQVSTFAFA